MELTTIETTLQTIEYTQALINFDNSKLIEFVKGITDKYTKLVVTEEILASITKEIAQLNKVTKTIESKRIEVKNGYNVPLESFEKKIKEVTAIIETAVAGLKSQTAIFEQKRRNEITANLNVIIDELIAEQGLDVKYRSQIIIQDNYYNKTAKEKVVRDDILRQVVLLKQSQELAELKAKQEIEAQERKRVELEAQIKARYELVETLNREHGFSFTANELEKYSNAELFSFYINKVQQRDGIKTEVTTTIEQKTNVAAPVIEAKIFNPFVSASVGKEIKNGIVLLTINNLSRTEAERIVASVAKTFTHATTQITEIA